MPNKLVKVFWYMKYFWESIEGLRGKSDTTPHTFKNVTADPFPYLTESPNLYRLSIDYLYISFFVFDGYPNHYDDDYRLSLETHFRI